MRLLIILLFLLSLSPRTVLSQEEYSFDISETEKKPYSLGGYAEFRPVLLVLDRDSALYKLRFFNRDVGDTTYNMNLGFLIDGSLQLGITTFFIETDTVYTESESDSEQSTNIFEGYLSISPSSTLTFNAGKKALRWGKGYAWNPVGFVEKSKDPNDPDLAREGFIMVTLDYTKSFSGALRTFSFSPVFLPVYEHINDSFGKINKMNIAGKLYLLLHDTDIDVMFLTSGSKTARYGFDFSRNIKANFEIHGEFAYINNFTKRFINDTGLIFESEDDVTSYLLGIRYLTKLDTTYIFEYYHNGTGFSSTRMRDYFSFINNAYDTFISSEDDTLLEKAVNITEGNYGKMNPMKDYLYLRISQKEPFDILYFTPSITWIYNMKASFIAGERESEYGEKQNDSKVELRARYFF
jgi:hypothetical protein